MRNDNFSKKIAAFLAATAASIFIVSIAYVAAEANHDCSGDNCPVCACVRAVLDEFALARHGGGASNRNVYRRKIFRADDFNLRSPDDTCHAHQPKNSPRRLNST